MKTCSDCKQEKELTEFMLYKDRGYYRSVCKKCSSDRANAWSAANPEKVKESQKRSREKTKEYIYSLKTPCVCCGESDPVVIDFHHIDESTKLFSIGSGTRGKAAIDKEVAKCVCVCANCHRKLHHGSIVLPKPDKLADQTSHKPGI